MILRQIYLIGIVLFSKLGVCFAAGIDCSPLDPRARLSSTTEGKIQGSAETLYKVAKAGASIEGRVQREARNLQEGVPISEASNIQNRLIYVFCEMIAKDNIPTERKLDLYSKLLDRFAPASTPVVAPRVNAPQRNPEAPAHSSQQKQTQPPTSRNASVSTPSKATQEAYTKKFYVQFSEDWTRHHKTREDAEQQRSELATSGLDSRITTMDLYGKDIFFVQSKNFDTRAEAEQLVAEARGRGIAAIVKEVQVRSRP